MKKIIVGIIIVVAVAYFFIQRSSDVALEEVSMPQNREEEVQKEIEKTIESPARTDEEKTSFTLAEVAEHGTQDDCWTAVDGEVFDLTPFISSHPGGVENIVKVCGIDGTSLFEAQHGRSPKAQGTITEFKIGTLVN